jgi:hypothetical protein
MKKLALDVESLVVESFEPQPGMRGGRGTVAGHALPPSKGITCALTCEGPTCERMTGCACPITAEATCEVSFCDCPWV